MKTEKLEAKIRELNGFEKFNPMQSKALRKEIYNKSVVISAPTASGKTVVAELCALNSIINEGKKVVYTCPLKAIASEHYRDFKKKYSNSLNIRVALSTGDLDSSSKYLSRYDLIFCTNEKIDSLIRHQAEWLKQTGLLIADEVHELDSDRGATLEMVISKLRFILPKLKILALSATIPNANELAEWLNAELIESDYRPVKLKEGILLESTIHFSKEKTELEEQEEPLLAVIENTLKLKKQALFFMNTRRNAEAFAKKAAKTVGKKLSPKEKQSLLILAEKVETVLESPTEQCTLLASLIKSGVCFHHAGLLAKQRELVEDAFKEGKIKVISATPTLAAGVNLPAFRVVIPTLYRYSQYGMQRIPVRDYKQQVGRAGRPKYDKTGESILLARTEHELEELTESYVEGDLEAVNSRLSLEPVLRMHILSLIASRFVFNEASLEDFFARTFYAKQYGSPEDILDKLSGLLEELEDFEFIECKDGMFSATPLGKRVSDLYLDPVSAKNLVDALKKKLDFFAVLFSFTNTFEFFPLVSVQKKRESDLWQELLAAESALPINVASEQFFDSDLLAKFNSALMLQEWTTEKSEQQLMEEFNTQPGILFAKLKICDWLAYASIELSKLLDAEENMPALLEARSRLKYGVKKELLPLVELRGIGRVRGRRLFRAGFRSATALKQANYSDLARVLGSGVAASVKEQLGQRVPEQKQKTEKKKEERKGQSSLSSF